MRPAEAEAALERQDAGCPGEPGRVTVKVVFFLKLCNVALLMAVAFSRPTAAETS